MFKPYKSNPKAKTDLINRTQQMDIKATVKV